MGFQNLFLKANNELEYSDKISKRITCKKCQKKLYVSEVRANYFVCPRCGSYFKVRARRRVLMLMDKRSFTEFGRELCSRNILNFPEYDHKLKRSMDESRENEGVVCGVGEINGIRCCIFSMDPYFMMGSMGSVVGEKITQVFEYATKNSLPVVGITVSGGARMQEGMISLMQMSKVSGAVKRHSDAGNLYVVLLTNPTMGGVEASFAMLGDITLAEPNARVGFAGPRVIEKTLNRALPKGFQMSERVMECGFIDKIVERRDQRQVIGKLLRLHCGDSGNKQRYE